MLDKDEEFEWINARADVPSLSLRAYAGTASRLPVPHDKLIRDLLRILETPYSPALRAYEVSREVNRASVDTLDLIKPVAPSEGAPAGIRGTAPRLP